MAKCFPQLSQNGMRLTNPILIDAGQIISIVKSGHQYRPLKSFVSLEVPSSYALQSCMLTQNNR